MERRRSGEERRRGRKSEGGKKGRVRKGDEKYGERDFQSFFPST